MVSFRLNDDDDGGGGGGFQNTLFT